MKTVLKIILTLIILSVLNGCLSIAHTVGTEVASGKIENFSGDYFLTKKETDENTKLAIVNSLLELKFKRQSNSELRFNKSNSKGATYGLGKVYDINVMVDILEDKIKVNIHQTGNYKYGTEAKTNETFELIKKEYDAK